MVKLTKMETEIVKSIIMTDHAGDGHGLGGWLEHYNFDMTKYRGAMASLTKKKVAYFETYEDEPNRTWGSVAEAHEKKICDPYEADGVDFSMHGNEEVQNIIRMTGYMLVDLELYKSEKN